MKSSRDVIEAKGTISRPPTLRQVQILQTIILFQRLNKGKSPDRKTICELLDIRHNQLFTALEGLYRRGFIEKKWRDREFLLTEKAIVYLKLKINTKVIP